MMILGIDIGWILIVSLIFAALSFGSMKSFKKDNKKGYILIAIISILVLFTIFLIPYFAVKSFQYNGIGYVIISIILGDFIGILVERRFRKK